MTEQLRERVLDWIDQDREMLIGLFTGFVRAKSPNPPGDTREAVSFLRAFLEQHTVPHRIIAPQAEMPNLVGSFEGSNPGRHLVLNGHVDVFPAGDGAGWTHDPWGGEVRDDIIWGRGTADMKCGTAALVATYVYMHRLREFLSGRLTLTCVSDEETGGWWGTRYLLETYPDEFLGDCVLSGEPSSPHTVRFGEKGALRVVMTVLTPGSHGAYPHKSASATKIAARLVHSLERLTELRPQPPHNIAVALNRPEIQAALEKGLGEGAAAVVPQVVVNIGVLTGGLKINMTPGECQVHADIRIPVGLEQREVRRALEAILTEYPEVTAAVTERHSYDSSWCDPAGEMLEIIQENALAVTGIRPLPVVTLAATDCRYWRQAGVPAYVYGPSPGNMGTRDEGVSIGEYIDVVKTHALSTLDYLTSPRLTRRI